MLEAQYFAFNSLGLNILPGISRQASDSEQPGWGEGCCLDGNIFPKRESGDRIAIWLKPCPDTKRYMGLNAVPTRANEAWVGLREILRRYWPSLLYCELVVVTWSCFALASRTVCCA